MARMLATQSSSCDIVLVVTLNHLVRVRHIVLVTMSNNLWENGKNVSHSIRFFDIVSCMHAHIPSSMYRGLGIPVDLSND